MEKQAKYVGSRVSVCLWRGIPISMPSNVEIGGLRCAPLSRAAQMQPGGLSRDVEPRTIGELGKDPSMDTIPCTELQFAPALRRKVCIRSPLDYAV